MSVQFDNSSNAAAPVFMAWDESAVAQIHQQVDACVDAVEAVSNQALKESSNQVFPIGINSFFGLLSRMGFPVNMEVDAKEALESLKATCNPIVDDCTKTSNEVAKKVLHEAIEPCSQASNSLLGYIVFWNN